MSNVEVQVALTNVQSKRRQKNMTPAQLRHHEKLSRFAKSRLKTSPYSIKHRVAHVVNAAGKQGITINGIKNLVLAEFGEKLKTSQVYTAVYYARKQGLIKNYDSAYYG